MFLLGNVEGESNIKIYDRNVCGIFFALKVSFKVTTKVKKGSTSTNCNT